MQIVTATVASNANVDLREFAESLDRRNPAIRVVKANRKSLRVEYGPLPEGDVAEYVADVRAWFGACLIQVGLAAPHSGAFRTTAKIRDASASTLTDSDARDILESIASVPGAGPRRGWAWGQMRRCPEPHALPLAA